MGRAPAESSRSSAFGDYTFVDFSVEKTKGELTTEQVKKVNAHFGVMMNECLAIEAEPSSRLGEV